MLKQLLKITTLCYGFLLLGLIGKVAAADFETEITRIYSINQAYKLTIEETHVVTNNSSNLLISKDNSKFFQIVVVSGSKSKLASIIAGLEITVDGNKSGYQSSVEGNNATITVPYNREVLKGQSIIFRLKYKNPGLIEHKGALTDIYVPGFPADFKFSQGQNQVHYQTLLRVHQDLPELNFVSPEAATVGQSGKYKVFNFTEQALVGKTLWMQLGINQIYKFTLTQQVTATEQKNSGYTNEYRILLPRDITEAKIEQQVFFSKISPEPSKVITDQEGNLIAYFKLPTNLTTQIMIQGYAKLSKKEIVLSADNSGLISQVDLVTWQKYLNPAEFWEVDAPEIVSQAEQLQKDDNIFATIKSDYNYIVNTIDYSNVKRFGLNQRQGALKTLLGGSAVCMEYSDLLIALTRAQNIPSRAVFGYGYDSKLSEDAQEAHQWVQVYLPGLNEWISVDVTWGESGDNLIGGDLNHFYTHVASQDPNTPALVERVSYGESGALSEIDFEITAVENIDDANNLLSQADVLIKYPEAQSVSFNLTVKTKSQLAILAGVILLILSAGLIYKEFRHKH